MPGVTLYRAKLEERDREVLDRAVRVDLTAVGITMVQRGRKRCLDTCESLPRPPPSADR